MISRAYEGQSRLTKRIRVQRRRVEGVTKVLVPSRPKHFVHTATGKKVGKEDNYMDLNSIKVMSKMVCISANAKFLKNCGETLLCFHERDIFS